MSAGQHVGAVSDHLVEDETRSAARAAQEALKKLARPIEREHRVKHDYGDGDRCPLAPEHGKMYVLTTRQYCSHAAHEGRPGRDGSPRTRAFWPKGDNALAAAVAAHQQEVQ